MLSIASSSSDDWSVCAHLNDLTDQCWNHFLSMLQINIRDLIIIDAHSDMIIMTMLEWFDDDWFSYCYEKIPIYKSS